MGMYIGSAYWLTEFKVLWDSKMNLLAFTTSWTIYIFTSVHLKKYIFQIEAQKLNIVMLDVL